MLLAGLLLPVALGQTIDEDLLRPPPSLETAASSEPQPSSGLLLRIYGQGLAGFYGDAFFEGPRPAISEAAFGFGGLLGGEIDGRLSIGLWGELLFGGVDTDPLSGFEGFANTASRRTSIGVATRVNLLRGGFRPYLGADGALMRQRVELSSSGGVVVPVRNRFGRVVGATVLRDAVLQARHEGVGVGPVVGFRARLTAPHEPEISFFAEAVLLHEWWRAAELRGAARRDRARARAVASELQALQGAPTAWTTTVRIGLHFGP